MEGPACPGCNQRDRENELLKQRVAALEARVAELLAKFDEKERAGKRQASPFAKGPPKKRPQKPGRKAGEQHGPHVHRPPPAPDAIDETLEAPLPDTCPH